MQRERLLITDKKKRVQELLAPMKVNDKKRVEVLIEKLSYRVKNS
jgi:hypothetical protein